MNISTLLGIGGSLIVVLVSVFLSLGGLSPVYDFPSVVIVVGGTATITLICFPMKKLAILTKVFMQRMLKTNKKDYTGLINNLVMLNDAYLVSKKSFESAVNQIKDPFLFESANVLFWLESDIAAEDLRDLLEQRANTHFERYMREAGIFRTIAKFPPAFGLIGTILGLVALLRGLGGPEAKQTIGPAMAVALITTLYGVMMANMIFTPIAENLEAQTHEDDVARKLVVEGIMLIERKMPSRFVFEKLQSYLLPSERVGGGTSRTSSGMKGAA